MLKFGCVSFVMSTKPRICNTRTRRAMLSNPSALQSLRLVAYVLERGVDALKRDLISTLWLLLKNMAGRLPALAVIAAFFGASCDLSLTMHVADFVLRP